MAVAACAAVGEALHDGKFGFALIRDYEGSEHAQGNSKKREWYVKKLHVSVGRAPGAADIQVGAHCGGEDGGEARRRAVTRAVVVFT